jgi:hypothetical protein
MLLADETDDYGALLDGFLRVLDLEYSTLRGAEMELVGVQRPS